MSSDFTGSGVAAYMSDRMDWETPAASSSNHKCAKYYTAEDSAFDHEWGGETVFCNPPYGKAIAEWVRKCSMEASRKDTTVVMLLPSRTDTRWWHRYILNRAEVRFYRAAYGLRQTASRAALHHSRPLSWSCGRERDNNHGGTQ